MTLAGGDSSTQDDANFTRVKKNLRTMTTVSGETKNGTRDLAGPFDKDEHFEVV
ncbi:MAG: hypothetical protein NVS9B13_14020 [Candidatus Acidiferrum sp.]